MTPVVPINFRHVFNFQCYLINRFNPPQSICRGSFWIQLSEVPCGYLFRWYRWNSIVELFFTAWYFVFHIILQVIK